MLSEISCYGNKKQYQVNQPEYITVLPNDIIVVSMWKNGHVVYFSSDLKCLQVLEVRGPGGLTVTPQGNVLMAARSPDRVCHLSGTPGDIKCDVIMEFSGEEDRRCGPITSLAMRGKQLAIVFDEALRLYQWT